MTRGAHRWCVCPLVVAGNGANRVSLLPYVGFGDRLTGGVYPGHAEPDSQPRPVFLAAVPRRRVPIDAAARQLTGLRIRMPRPVCQSLAAAADSAFPSGGLPLMSDALSR